eukprot:gene2687-3654_t
MFSLLPKKAGGGAFYRRTLMATEPPNPRASPHDNAGFLERTFADHAAPLTRYAARLLGDADRARDVVQDTFVKFMAQPVAAVDGHVVEWLFTVCRHRALDVLRKEIDSIDAQVHSLLMQRGDIIDRLISVKQTQEVGSAFRPAREADMMRRMVQRHRGILPIDTVESIWRVIIATFTYVQAPFSVHADLSLGESAMRDSARFHFGFTVPYVAHFSAAAAVEAVAKSKGDLALVSATSSRTPWWIELEAKGAPKIIARLLDPARAVERIARRQRMDERPVVGDRMGAAGGEHALDVGFVDLQSGNVDAGAEHLGAQPTGRQADDQRFDGD